MSICGTVFGYKNALSAPAGFDAFRRSRAERLSSPVFGEKISRSRRSFVRDKRKASGEEGRKNSPEAARKGKEEKLTGCWDWERFWRRGPESNRLIEILQTSAFPLGYHAAKNNGGAF